MADSAEETSNVLTVQFPHADDCEHTMIAVSNSSFTQLGGFLERFNPSAIVTVQCRECGLAAFVWADAFGLPLDQAPLPYLQAILREASGA